MRPSYPGHEPCAEHPVSPRTCLQRTPGRTTARGQAAGGRHSTTHSTAQDLTRLTRRNRYLAFALLVALGNLAYQGWHCAAAWTDHRILSNQRTAVLRSIEKRQRDFMRHHNRYGGSLEKLHLPLAQGPELQVTVVTYGTKDGPAFFAEVCNPGGCDSLDQTGVIHPGRIVRLADAMSIEPAPLEAAVDEATFEELEEDGE